MPPRLPNELADAIISSVASTERFLPEDRQTLRNCTLVCSDWLPASRHALFFDVKLTTPAAWDSFLRWVVNAETGRPWLASIFHLEFSDKWYNSCADGKDIPAEPTSAWRGQYVVSILAGHLPNLEFLSLSVDWDRCPPHPTTFGMFSQFKSICELRLSSCRFPSFCTFRRVLVSLPALKRLACIHVDWPFPPQPSVLVVPSKLPALESLRMSLPCRSCTLAVLEWLIHTPTRLTLVIVELYPGWITSQHRVLLPGRTLDYYAQIFAPSIRQASFGQSQMNVDIECGLTVLPIMACHADSRVLQPGSPCAALPN